MRFKLDTIVALNFADNYVLLNKLFQRKGGIYFLKSV